jgi:hypothetical protein
MHEKQDLLSWTFKTLHKDTKNKPIPIDFFQMELLKAIKLKPHNHLLLPLASLAVLSNSFWLTFD